MAYPDCYIEFDGASRGNPGRSGAGAIVRSYDGSRIWRLRQGLGTTTNNVAEYRGLILGMKFALHKGFRVIGAYGDSLLVCNQVNGQWEVRNPTLISLNEEVQQLKSMFSDFWILHVRRESNADADFEANEASNLPNGVTEEL